MSERAEQRRRPADPAGTQPKVDPRSLESAQLALAAGEAQTLGQPSDGDSSYETESPLRHAVTAAAAAEAAHAEPISAPAAMAPAHLTSASAEPPHAARFQFLFGALGAVAVTAIVLAAVLLSAPAKAPEKLWSTWRPHGDGSDPAQQIADHVSLQYRLDDGKQIVAVTGGPPALKGQPLTLGVVRSGQQPARLEGNSVLFQMCGGGTDCSIKDGKPSVERGLLLNREALELALYTFRYVGGVDQVIVTIPPPHTTGATAATVPSSSSKSAGKTVNLLTSTATAHHALMFRQQDVASELDHPLSSSLSAYTPRVSQMNGSVDAALVKQLTGSRLYDFIIDEVPQSGPVLLLEPPGLGG